MSAKYQVFVSSTFTDLKDERELVIKAILEMGHIPVGMEMFSAADEAQWNIIKKQIDQSDYYIVIVAHRYGSCDTTGLSYTEKEFDYALSKNIPSLGFVIEEGAPWPRQKSDADRATLKKLGMFKAKVKAKPVSFWRAGDDLYGRCSIALMKAFNAYPREGWVRASQVQDVVASKEVVRLSAENADLRSQLSAFLKDADESVAIERTLSTFRANKRGVKVWKKGATAYTLERTLTLYQIFEMLAPELQIEEDLESINLFVACVLAGVSLADMRAEYPAPQNFVRALLADFSALNCIVPSTRVKPSNDVKEYWMLTDFGIKVLSTMRRRRLEHVEEQTKVLAPQTHDLDA